MKIIDQHVHTEFSIDSQVDLEDYFKLAQTKGISHLSFTDHVDYDALDYDGLDILVDYEEILKKGQGLEKKYGIKLNLGVEMGYRSDLETEIREYMDGKEYGIVLFSVHQDQCAHYAIDPRSDDEKVKAYFGELNAMLDSDFSYDVVTHIDYVLRYLNDKTCFEKYSAAYDEILSKIIKRDVILEINTKSALIIGSLDFAEYILKKYKALGGVKVSLGSDCHCLERYQDKFDEIITMMKKQGFASITEVIDREHIQRTI